MSAPHQPPRPVLMLSKVAGSVIAIAHLSAVALLALAAPSGPWFVPKLGMPSEAEGPRFAGVITSTVTYPYYLVPTRMTHNYHFASNRLQLPAAYFEVHLKDERGKVFKSLKFPDDKASFAVRHRQDALARGLANDQPPLPRTTQAIPAKGAMERTEDIWELGKDGTYRIENVPISEAQDKQAPRPSKFSKVLAQSYVRYLCREHGAVSAELIRHSKEQAIPSYLFMPGYPPDAFNELKSHFGEYRP